MTSSAVDFTSTGVSGMATATAAPDPSEWRLDNGEGPFLFREFLQHYHHEEEALRRWREAGPSHSASAGSAGAAAGEAVDDPIRAGRPAAASL